MGEDMGCRALGCCLSVGGRCNFRHGRGLTASPLPLPAHTFPRTLRAAHGALQGSYPLHLSPHLPSHMSPQHAAAVLQYAHLVVPRHSGHGALQGRCPHTCAQTCPFHTPPSTRSRSPTTHAPGGSPTFWAWCAARARRCTFGTPPMTSWGLTWTSCSSVTACTCTEHRQVWGESVGEVWGQSVGQKFGHQR